MNIAFQQHLLSHLSRIVNLRVFIGVVPCAAARIVLEILIERGIGCCRDPTLSLLAQNTIDFESLNFWRDPIVAKLSLKPRYWLDWLVAPTENWVTLQRLLRRLVVHTVIFATALRCSEVNTTRIRRRLVYFEHESAHPPLAVLLAHRWQTEPAHFFQTFFLLIPVELVLHAHILQLITYPFVPLCIILKHYEVLSCFEVGSDSVGFQVYSLQTFIPLNREGSTPRAGLRRIMYPGLR